MQQYFKEEFGIMDTIDEFIITNLIGERTMLDSSSFIESPLYINATKIILDVIIEEFCHMVKGLFQSSVHCLIFRRILMIVHMRP